MDTPTATAGAAIIQRAPGSATSTSASASTSSASTASPAEGAQPEPDLDALARQVYSVLKRRLAAERRRLS
jgi:hypothetical protein